MQSVLETVSVSSHMMCTWSIFEESTPHTKVWKLLVSFALAPLEVGQVHVFRPMSCEQDCHAAAGLEHFLTTERPSGPPARQPAIFQMVATLSPRILSNNAKQSPLKTLSGRVAWARNKLEVLSLWNLELFVIAAWQSPWLIHKPTAVFCPANSLFVQLFWLDVS